MIRGQHERSPVEMLELFQYHLTHAVSPDSDVIKVVKGLLSVFISLYVWLSKCLPTSRHSTWLLCYHIMMVLSYVTNCNFCFCRISYTL